MTYEEAGLVKTIPPPSFPFDEKLKILKAILPLGRRLNYYARQMLIHSYQNGKTLNEDGSVNWSLVRESMDFLKTDKGKKALIVASKNLKPRLMKQFTIRKLTQPIRSTFVRASR